MSQTKATVDFINYKLVFGEVTRTVFLVFLLSSGSKSVFDFRLNTVWWTALTPHGPNVITAPWSTVSLQTRGLEVK